MLEWSSISVVQNSALITRRTNDTVQPAVDGTSRPRNQSVDRGERNLGRAALERCAAVELENVALKFRLERSAVAL